MSGLINTAPATMGNRVLAAAERKVESQLTPENKANYLKIVLAGMHAGLEGGPNGLLGSLKKSQDPITDAAKGAVSLVLILRKQARGIVPPKAMVPAAMTLMLRALDFCDRAGIVKVGAPELVRATHVFTDAVFGAFHITADMLKQAGTKVSALTQSPEAMRAINVKAGIIPHGTMQ